MKKLKKPAKIEKIFGGSSEEERVFAEKNQEETQEEYDVLADYETEEDKQETAPEEVSELTEKQIQKQSEIETVKSTISKILKSSNIEIVDENFGDEFEDEDGDAAKSKQDYDALKALFGDKDRNKKDELTLTIDDFDYTYVGKYIEEYDLMHLKNIKRIKLRNPNAKKIKRAMIAAGLILVVGLGGALGWLLTRQSPVVMTTVGLSQSSSTSNYFVGEKFSFDGLFINVGYSDGSLKRVQLNAEHLDHTEGGSVDVIGDEIQFLGGNVSMVFNYEGYNLTYNIEVKPNRTLEGIEARYSDKIFHLNAGEFIGSYANGKSDLIVLFDYGEYGLSKAGNYDNITVKVDGVSMPYEKGKGWRMTTSTEGKLITVEYMTAAQTFTTILRK